MNPFAPPSITIAVIFASFMAARGVKRKSLTKGGAACAFAVGFLSLACGLRGFLLLLFYVIGSKATKYKAQQKMMLDDGAADSSCRGVNQVMACSVIGVAIQLVHVIYCGEEQSIDFDVDSFASALACALIAHHSTNLADTLASELGILSKGTPVLITSGRSVPRGTNGGVTSLGVIFSVLGGFISGTGALIVDTISGLDVKPASYIIFGGTCGFVGSVVDSILGATVQVTYYDEEKKCIYSHTDQKDEVSRIVHVSGRNVLTNAEVNVVSILITSAFGFGIGRMYF